MIKITNTIDTYYSTIARMASKAQYIAKMLIRYSPWNHSSQTQSKII